MSSSVQINNFKFEVKNGKPYINGNEIIKNKIDSEQQTKIFCLGFLFGILTCILITVLVTS
jgi:hypothetical protein